MNDERKTKTQLIQELDVLRQRCAELETIKAEWVHTSESLPGLIDLNEIIQNMVEGIFVMDADGHIAFVNPASAALLGRVVDELIGMHWTELISPDHHYLVEAANQRREQGISDRYELDLLRKDGERVRVQVSGSPRIHPETGRFVGTLGVFADLTERVQVEKELREHRNHLEELIEERTNALKQANIQLQQEISERKRAQEEINRQKEYFEALFLNNPVAVVTTDMDVNIVSWNPMAEKLFGYSGEEVIGRNLDEVVTGDEPMLEEAVEYSRKVIRSRGHFITSTKRARKDSSLVDVEILALPVIVSGERVGFVAIYHDITDRVRAEAELLMYQEQLEELVEERTIELRKSEERYRTLFDGVPIGLYRSTPAGQNLDINLAAVQMLGFRDREELLATSPKTYYVNLEDRERWATLMAKEGVVRDFEAQFRRNDDSVIWVNDSARAVLDEDGRVLYYEGSLEDITERKEAEEELRKYQEHLEELVEERTSELQESEARYRSLFDGVPVGLYRSTPAGEILDVNLAFVEITGAPSRKELLKTSTSSFYADPDQQKRWRELMEQEGVVRDFEIKSRRFDGTSGWASDTARAVKDDQGQVLYYEGRVEDISERKHAEEELRQAKEAAEAANQAKSTFLANMSHELRTPLNAIMGFTRLVRRRSEDLLPQKQLDNLDKVLVSADHLLGLINDVLDLSKIEAGRVEVQAETFHLDRLIDNCLRTVLPLVTTQNLSLKKEIVNELPDMFTDQDKLRQILINLLGNAIKFTEEGTVTVSATSENGLLRIAVKDTGIGIPEDALDRIFEEFQQVDSSTTREFGGTGLGLSISRHLARLLGGDISVESTEGEGSTFTVTIPVHIANT